MAVFQRLAPFALALAAFVGGERQAHAVLSPSENAQIKQYVTLAQVTNAQRVRALIARPDLSTDESVTAMSDALSPVTFTDGRGAFLRDMMFGGASAPSRSLLVYVVTRGVLARANEVLSRHAGDLDAHPESLAELSRIYTFLDTEIGAAGARRGAGREPSNGISLATFDDCAKAMGQHIDHNPKWLKADAAISTAASRVRAQAELALVDLTNDSPTFRVDVADKLGLTGARRSFLTELGILVLDAGKADNARVDRLRALLGRLPGTRVDTTAIYFGDANPGLHARGQILAFRTPLEIGSGGPPMNPFPDEVEPGSVDAATFALTRDLANVAVERALAARPELRQQTERDVRAVTGDAKKLLGRADLDADSALIAAVQLLVTDAPRTVDLAFARFLGGEPESAAILSDALGALAAFPLQGNANDGLTLAVGKPKGADGTTETALVTGVRLLPYGAVSAFTLLGHRWELARGASGAITGVRRDGAPLSLLLLPSAHVPVSSGLTWSEGGLAFARLSGSPRAGVGPGARVRIVGTEDKGMDAIGTPAPGNDLVVDTDVRVRGDGGGLVVRATAAQDAFRGISLFFLPSPGPMLLSVRATEESGKETDLVTGQVASAPLYHVHLALRGTRLDVNVAGTMLHATVPAGYAHGDFALRARKGASVETVGLTLKKL